MKTAETLLSGQAASVLGAIHCTGSHTGETEAERLRFGGVEGGTEGGEIILEAFLLHRTVHLCLQREVVTTCFLLLSPIQRVTPAKS